jgi:hypothetical protein
MAKKGSRGSRRTRKMMSNQQGGNAPDSAWGYVMNTVGDGWTQFMDTFSVQPGENAGAMNSNQLVSIKNPNINDPSSSILKQTGGKRRKGKGKKGGFLGVGAVLEQAVVPFGLLAIQQSYGKSKRAKRGGSKRSRRMH